MSADPPALNPRLYFGQLSIVLIEANDLESDITSQILSGFKVRNVNRFKTQAETQEHLSKDIAELVLVGSILRAEGEPDIYDFVRGLRQSRVERIRTVSVILLEGHTLQSNVARARDCGANFVVAKPITPRVLYDRIVWLAKDGRAFVESSAYCGPDRRFQKLGPPPDTNGRRKGDLSLNIGEAKAPNMSQSEIDAMLSGKGAARPL